MTQGSAMPRSTRGGEHPGLVDLALYVGKDLAWIRMMKTRLHLQSCTACGATVAQLRQADEEFLRQAAGEMLTGFEAIADWSRLESDMVGNISVGLSAARCVDASHPHRRWILRTLATTGLAMLFVAGWLTHIPMENTRNLLSRLTHWTGSEPATLPGTVMRSSAEGIAVRAQGSTLTMRLPHSAIVSVAGDGSMEGRYVDEETGQVTISSVYGQ